MSLTPSASCANIAYPLQSGGVGLIPWRNLDFGTAGTLTPGLPDSRSGVLLTKRPWIRLYTDVPHNPKVQRLAPDVFKFWINVLCLSSEDGRLPKVEDIAFATHIRPHRVRKYLEKLLAADLIDRDWSATGALSVHAWDERQFASDLSNERVKRHRDRYRNVTSAVTVTPPEQSRADQNRAEPAASRVSDLTLYGNTWPDDLPADVLIHLRRKLQAATTRIARSDNPAAYERTIIEGELADWRKRA
jgi:hypothetical protein